MTQIFILTHEANNFSEYTASSTGNDLTTGAAAGMDGTNFGVIGDMDVAHVDSATKNFASSTDVLRLEFFFNKNTLTPTGSDGDEAQLLVVQDVLGGDQYFDVWFNRFGSGQIRFRVATEEDGPGAFDLFTGALPGGDLHIKFTLQRASSAVANDGICTVYVNSVLEDQQLGIDNFDIFSNLANADLVLSLSEAGPWTGEFYIDQIAIYDTLTDAAATNEFTAAPMKKPCAVDMDGSFIYIAALDSLGQPALIKFSTGLSSDGTVVFQPGAGDDIGVQCGRKDADVIWIGGDFGGGDVLEKSEDGGQTWSVKDPGTFDAISSFSLSPSDDETILAATNISGSAASGTLQLSVDDGATWQEVNSSTGVNVTDIAMLDKNDEEVVIGGESPDEVNYSVNDGADLEDISASGPTHDTNKLIVG